MPVTLETATALVFGSASGIGRATARALAVNGANVVLADIDADGARAGADEIVSAGGEAMAVGFDVAKGSYEDLRDRVMDRFGRIDVVMNNVGAVTNGLPEAIPVEEWQRIFELNLLSVVKSNQVFVPLLTAQASGHIVNTASVAGLFTYAFDRTPYAACKAALVQLSEALAIYLAPQGVGVTLLCPGPVMTNISQNMRHFGEPQPMRTPGRDFALLQPEDVAPMVIDAIRQNRFFVPTHEAAKVRIRERAADWDGYIREQIENPTIVVLPQA